MIVVTFTDNSSRSISELYTTMNKSKSKEYGISSQTLLTDTLSGIHPDTIFTAITAILDAASSPLYLGETGNGIIIITTLDNTSFDYNMCRYGHSIHS